MQGRKNNAIGVLHILMWLVNPLVDLTLFLNLGHKYNLEENISLKILFLLFLSTWCSLCIYKKDKDVINMNNSYIASDKHNCKLLVGRKEKERKRERERIYC